MAGDLPASVSYSSLNPNQHLKDFQWCLFADELSNKGTGPELIHDDKVILCTISALLKEIFKGL